MNDTDTLTIGEIGRTLARLEKGQDGIAAQLQSFGQAYVTRGEWEMHRKEVAGLRAEATSRRPQWTAVASTVVAISALVLTIVQIAG